jgi:signal transduction histidine kinase
LHFAAHGRVAGVRDRQAHLVAGGAGLFLYALLWLRMMRTGSELRPSDRPADMAPLDAAGQVGLAIAFLGLLLLLRAAGLWFGDELVVPVAFGAVGSVLIWSRADARGRAQLRNLLPLPRPLRGSFRPAAVPALRVSPARILGGTVLVGIAMVALLAANDALVAMRELGVAVLAAAIGLALLFGPWAIRLIEAAGLERRARIREEERGEIAAHLHDSVLQSLALIQRASDDPQRMAAIARRQERELRRWLFEGRAAEDASTLAGALEAAIAALEDTHGVTVELVRAGDAPLTPPLTALVAAVREAIGNAARHAGVPALSVFVEVGEQEVVAFVRDRGVGFDPAAVMADRSGIRHSIRGRLERHGGRSELTTAPHEGCEWELAVPRSLGRSGEAEAETLLRTDMDAEIASCALDDGGQRDG